MFWVICAAMLVLVGAAIALPLLRGTREDVPAAAYDLGVYRDQLREVDRDVARGVMAEDEAARLRTEIGRKVLDADRALQAAHASSSPPARTAGAVALGALLVGSAGLYATSLGSPSMPDEPIRLRLAQADERYKARPTQAEAEKTAPPIQAPPADPQFTQLIEQLRKAVAAQPDDPRGLELLARNEARLGNMAAARKAQEHLLEVKGDSATAMDHIALAFLKIEMAGGVITADAETDIARALQLDPQNGQARYLQGMLFGQNGRPDRTFAIWSDLLERGPEDAPWIAPIRASIRDLAWIAGQPQYEPPAPGGAAMPAMPGTGAPMMPGPDAGQVEAAADMTPEERQQMIAGMVQRLRDRLETEGGTTAEWGRLITSLAMIGDKAGARAALDKARAAHQGDRAALATLDAAAMDAGLQ